MESQQLIGVVVATQINVMPMKVIVTVIRIVLELLFVEQTIVRQQDYQEAIGVLVQIAAWVCFLLN